MLLCPCVWTCEHTARACLLKNIFGDAQSSPLMPSATRRRGHIPGPTISDVGAKTGSWGVADGYGKEAGGSSNAPIVSAAQNGLFFPPESRAHLNGTTPHLVVLHLSVLLHGDMTIRGQSVVLELAKGDQT